MPNTTPGASGYPARRLSPAAVAEIEAQAAGIRSPAGAKSSASVVLTRARTDGQIEVLFMSRQSTMTFASGMMVFPGGGVADSDRDTDIDSVGPSWEEWSRTLGTTPDEAGAIITAAVRETFEETGVLLVGSAAELVSDTSSLSWEAARVALERHEVSFADVLRREGLALRTDLLTFWSVWRTPRHRPKRYQTWFFTAGMPPQQVERLVGTEAVDLRWLTLGDVVSGVEDESLKILPPQYFVCREMLETGLQIDPHGRSRSEVIEPAVVFDGSAAYLDYGVQSHQG